MIVIEAAAPDNLIDEDANLARMIAKSIVALSTATVSDVNFGGYGNGLLPDARTTWDDLAVPGLPRTGWTKL